MLRVGFIALGAMGRPISLHLLRHGYPLGVYARRPETVEPIVAAGAGQTTKACHQLVLLITAEAAAEGLALAARCGLDPSLVREVMLRGLASSRVLDLFGDRMARRAFEAGIPVRLYEKDLGFVADT